MTTINWFREDLANLLGQYDAELSIDDNGNFIEVYSYEEKKTYNICKSIPDLKKESINRMDLIASVECGKKD